MGDRASAERACKEQNPIIDGRKANVNLAILGAKPRGNVQAGKSHFVCVVCLLLGEKGSMLVDLARWTPSGSIVTSNRDGFAIFYSGGTRP